MADKFECAVLSAAVYDNSRNLNNKLLPSGLLDWRILIPLSDMIPGQTRGGFSATAYQNGNEIIFATTQFVTIY